MPDDWRERFIRAYDTEFQEWIDAVVGRASRPGRQSWDGYAATVVCDAALQALGNGDRVEVSLREQPDLYRTAAVRATGTD